MSLYGDRDAATAADPQAPQAELARLAWERPDLRPVIALNPQAYPDLLGWLASQNDPATTAALRQRAAQTVAAMPPVPAAPAQPPTSVAPTAPSYPAAQPYQAQPYPAAQPYQAAQPYPAAQPYQTQPSSPAPQADLFAPPGSTGQAPVTAQPDLFARPAVGGQPSYTARSFDPQPSPGFGPAETSFTPATAKRSRKPLLVGIGAAVTVVIAASSVFAYTQVFSKVGGSSSPEAAASQLLHAVADRDLVGIGGAIAPSEVTPFKDLSSQLEDVASAASGSSSNPSEEVTSSVMDLLDAFDVKLSDLELDATTVDDGLARVEITSGTLTIDADPATLSDAAVTFLQELEQQVAEQSGGAQDYSSLLGDPESSRAQVEDWAAASLPFTFSISDIPPGSFTPLLMAVEEDGGWYVSPLMTIGEYAVMSAGVARGAMPTGDQIASYSTPQEAASGMVEAVADAVSTGTITQLVASLPQMERRFAAVYLVPLLGSEQATSETTLTVTDSTFTVAAAGNSRALLVPDSVTLDYADSWSQGSLHLSGYCGTVTTDGDTSSGCLTDQPIATELGVDTMSIVAVQEDGRWFVSPSATLVDMTRILATNLQRLQQEGKLDDPAWLEQQLGVDGSSGLEGLLGSSLLGPSLLGYGYGYEDSGF